MYRAVCICIHVKEVPVLQSVHCLSTREIQHYMHDLSYTLFFYNNNNNAQSGR